MLDVRYSYRGEHVVARLDRVCRTAGYPKTVRVDQGSEFVSRDMDLWAYQRGVVLEFSRPNKPTDNTLSKPLMDASGRNVSTSTGSSPLRTLPKSWRLGVDTTTRNGYTARSATTSRSC